MKKSRHRHHQREDQVESASCGNVVDGCNGYAENDPARRGNVIDGRYWYAENDAASCGNHDT
jgi:hypothetical protein